MFDTLAVVGATGAVGRIVLQLIEQRSLPFRRLKLLASKRTAGTQVTLNGSEHTVEEMTPESFEGVQLAIGSTPDPIARDFVPWATERGCVVIDESGYWRMDPTVPLIVPEVNPEAVAEHQGIICSPNCSTTQMVLAMKPLHEAGRIKRVVVSTYQATSGAGLSGSEELEEGSKAHLAGDEYEYDTFAHPIAFNVIPQIGSEKFQGYTSEEMKMVYETQKIFGDDSIKVCPTCVRVPVTNCHSESIMVETEKKITVEEARELFSATPGLVVMDDLKQGKYPMPINCDESNDTYIGRIREDISCKNGLAFWCVSDNLRKGAATNAVQIAELLAEKKLAVIS